MSNTIVNEVDNALLGTALSTIDVNPTNFQVFTLAIALILFIGIAFILMDCIIFASQNQTLNSTTFVGLVIANIVFVVLMLLAYLYYLRNIGRYVYSRVKPTKLK